jgi:TonB family protein
MNRTMPKRFVPSFALLLLLLAATLNASTAVEKLNEKLAESSDLLKAGKYADALKLDDVVIREMGEYYVSGDATTRFFTIAVVHKALALSGLGKQDDALWYWHLAVSLYPAMLGSDMADYGKAGEFLKQNPPGELRVMVPRGAKITPPSITKQTEPKFPSQTLNAQVEGPIVIDVVIGKDGKPRSPKVIDTLGAPMLAYATAEAVRQWEFSPALAGDQPVESRYRVTIRYKVR